MSRQIYLDNAATTPLIPEVIDAITEFMKEDFGNPSSTHAFGRKTKNTIENCRRSVANHFGAKPSEIIFTSGATEANNIIIGHCIKNLGVKRIITCEMEHKAVLDTVKNMAKAHNITVDYIDVCQKGNAQLTHLEELLNQTEKGKTLVSLMMVNNEVGNILDGKATAKICNQHNALFHSDTVQFVAHDHVNFREWGIDFATCSAHKFHGPKGIGFLYAAKEATIAPLLHGGSQERGFRPGTENTIGIVGLSKALDVAMSNLEKDVAHMKQLKHYFIEQLNTYFSNQYKVNGDVNKGLCTILSIGFSREIANELLLFSLDLKGIAASGGSACNSGSNQGSHVLRAIPVDDKPFIPVRFSFSKLNTKEEIDYCIGVLQELLKKPE